MIFKQDVTGIFCEELLSIKEPQAMLQDKETTVQSYRMLNKYSKKILGIERALFNCTGEM